MANLASEKTADRANLLGVRNEEAGETSAPGECVSPWCFTGEFSAEGSFHLPL